MSLGPPEGAGGPADAFFRRLAAHAALPYLVGGELPAARDAGLASVLPATFARAFGVVPVRFEGDRVLVAASTPAADAARSAVFGLSGRQTSIAIAAPEAIRRAQESLYGPPEAAPLERPARATEADAGERSRYRALARHAGLEFVDLGEPAAPAVDREALAFLSADTCRSLRVLPIGADNDEIVLVTATPFDTLGHDVVRLRTGRRPRLVVATPSALDAALDRVTDGSAEVMQPDPLGGAPLGDMLVGAGAISRTQVAEALETQARVGGRVGELLVHAGSVDELAVAKQVSRQTGIPLVDLTGTVPDPQALALIPEPISRRRGVVPLRIVDHVLELAVSEPIGSETLDDLRRHTQLGIRPVLGTRSGIVSLLARTYASRYVRIATTDLLNRSPDESAYKVLSFPQKIVAIALATVTLVLLVYAPITTVIVLNVLSIAFYSSFSLYKFKLIYDALEHDLELPVSQEEIEALDERTLPVYTILVPLYREANVVLRLVSSLAQLDYPQSKLDVKLIVEEDDSETIEALAAARLPAHLKLVAVPDGLPKTKPKACNYGLIQAEGRYVVIYDAEDRPEPDQLKKAVIAFSKADERIVCIQCKLNYYNRNQNALTRWFTTEYSSWFDLFMPGLDAADSPIPLGGTSNHLIREKLIELGAWDPYNVTEDADLGIRLHKAGYKTAIIDSTTFEEANSDLYNWIRQRSRWVKGYIQTWLVHMRHPVSLWRRIGSRSFVSFQFVVAGTFVGFLLNPIYWALTTLWLASHAGVIRSLFPPLVYHSAAVGLLIGNFVFAYVNVVGSFRRGYYDLVKWSLFSPIYWALMSVGAYKGLFQLLYRPHYWEKTVHGLDVRGEQP